MYSSSDHWVISQEQKCSFCFFKVEIENKTLEDYQGPSSKVDFILLANVLSLFADTATKQVQRCMEWLKPGGHIVIILNTVNPILQATGMRTL